MKFEEMPREELTRELEKHARGASSENDQERIVHDLRVHQVELELQNRELREAHCALEESRSRYQELYDFAPVAYYTFDLHGVISEVNLTGATMLGRDRARLLGLPFLPLVKMEDPGLFWAHLRRCTEERKPVVSEMHFSIERSGSRDVQIVSAPVLDASGKVVAFRTSFVDIGERKRVEVELARARAEEARLRKRFEALDHASLELNDALRAREERSEARLLQVIVDEARVMVDAESSALGIGAQLDRHVESWYSSGDPPDVRALLGDVARSGRSTRQFSSPPGTKSVLAVALSAGGRPIGAICVMNKRAADAFSEDDQQVLEMFVVRAGLAMDVARLTEDVRTAMRARDNLLAVVSHDMRSPLQAILVSANLLTRCPEEGERRKNRRQIDVILRSSARIQHLLNDLLEAAIIEAGTFTIEPSREAVAPIIEDGLEALEPLATAKSIRLVSHVEDVPAIWGDRQRLVQVLQNILGNAVKFTPERGTIEVRAEPRAGEVCVTVSDSGPGIPEDQLPHLFDRYWKGKPEGRHGAGLGLYIAKGIVNAHGGSLWAKSEVGVGSTFGFSVPTAKHV